MSSQADYQVLKEEIEKVEKSSLPSLPVDTILQEAENLIVWADKDVELLKSRGLSLTLLSSLSKRAGALRHAEAFWFKSRYEKTELEKQWKVECTKAFALRDELINEFEFAFYGDVSLLSAMPVLKKGKGIEDMIQDLMDLSLLGKDNAAKFNTTGLDMLKLDKAAALSDALAKLLAQKEASAHQNQQHILIRNKAFWYLWAGMYEVRRIGKFVFRKDHVRLQGYFQTYRRKKN